MTLTEAMEIRRSRRKYRETPIAPSAIAALRTLAAQYGEAAGARIELVFGDGSAFNGLRKSYGMFAGVHSYAGLIAPKNDRLAAERLGCYGELLLLHAVALGLGTCWVGGSFDRMLCPFKIGENEELICTITLGYANEKNSLRENVIYGITHRKTKTAEQMMVTDVPAPDWFMNGMRAVQKAPSAVNRQPVTFTLKDGEVTARTAEGTAALLDMGIAKLHFALGAGTDAAAWDFETGKFTRT